MKIITKSDDLSRSIILDNVIEITRGDSISTCAATYYGWHVINFKGPNNFFTQWDYGKTEEGKILRDEEYKRIISIQ